jgi:hypothetical protein
MKKFSVFAAIFLLIAVCICLSSYNTIVPTKAYAESKAKVLLIPREGYSADIELMLTKEIDVMTSMLNEAGFDVVVATTSGVSIKAPI